MNIYFDAQIVPGVTSESPFKLSSFTFPRQSLKSVMWKTVCGYNFGTTVAHCYEVFVIPRPLQWTEVRNMCFLKRKISYEFVQIFPL